MHCKSLVYEVPNIPDQFEILELGERSRSFKYSTIQATFCSMSSCGGSADVWTTIAIADVLEAGLFPETLP